MPRQDNYGLGMVKLFVNHVYLFWEFQLTSLGRLSVQ